MEKFIFSVREKLSSLNQTTNWDKRRVDALQKKIIISISGFNKKVAFLTQLNENTKTLNINKKQLVLGYSNQQKVATRHLIAKISKVKLLG